MDVDACILLDTKASTYLGALSPLGSRVATASEDGEVRVWYAGGLGDPVVITAHDKSSPPTGEDIFLPEGRTEEAHLDTICPDWSAGSAGGP